MHKGNKFIDMLLIAVVAAAIAARSEKFTMAAPGHGEAERLGEADVIWVKRARFEFAVRVSRGLERLNL
ncbi:hypothetical protein A2U01_0061243 [Trifolium medium]|uniref:Uncharacterized protein n=1 Tax=Trifolium medium TaxID=97028 RepID=A0A392RTN4_9FABA|nr:hypothetical protein [Trifolium medium]